MYFSILPTYLSDFSISFDSAIIYVLLDIFYICKLPAAIAKRYEGIFIFYSNLNIVLLPFYIISYLSALRKTLIPYIDVVMDAVNVDLMLGVS